MNKRKFPLEEVIFALLWVVITFIYTMILSGSVSTIIESTTQGLILTEIEASVLTLVIVFYIPYLQFAYKQVDKLLSDINDHIVP